MTDIAKRTRCAAQGGRGEMRYITLTSLSAVPAPLIPAAGAAMADPIATTRQDVENVLRLLARDLPTLRPARPDLLRAAAEAVAGLQGGVFPPDGIRKLSVGRTLAGFGDVPARGFHSADAIGRFVIDVHERLSTPLADLLISRLNRVVVDAIGADADREIGRLVRNAFSSRLLAHENDPLDAIAHVVWRSYHECLRLQFGLVAAKRDEVRTTTRFIDLFGAGNIPAGTLDDGSFLVLVA